MGVWGGGEGEQRVDLPFSLGANLHPSHAGFGDGPHMGRRSTLVFPLLPFVFTHQQLYIFIFMCRVDRGLWLVIGLVIGA